VAEYLLVVSYEIYFSFNHGGFFDELSRQ
jgi:hypothetical protein